MKNLVCFLLIIFFFSFLCFSQSSNGATKRTTITIENALSTQYEKDKETGNDIINLLGDVKISVESGSSKNVISADSIRYDRTSEMMYASGNVSLEMTTSSAGTQNVTADSLMFNTSTLEGVFDDGRVVQTKSDAINLPSGSTLVVSSDVFGRSESNTIAFKNGVLTFCDDEDPHWNIKASRIWLLPGGEFAFLNALLYVGAVPVFYLPAFYYPKDELIFNPVFGHEKRRGYYNQNTFYLYGRKPLDTTSSTSSGDSEGDEKIKALFNFIKPSALKEQRREGLILHNLDDDYKGDTTNYFKIMGDYYTNLGGMVGLAGTFKPKSVFTSVDTSLYLGFSNTVFRNSGNYLPYNIEGVRYYDSSNFMGLELPFRYGGDISLSMSKPFSLSVKIPIWSDPYFSDDFVTNRTESMDWISYLLDQNNDDDEDETQSTISSFTWNMNGSYSIPLPEFVKPFVSSASVSVTSSLVWTSKSASSNDLKNDNIKKTDLDAWKTYTPNRSFYYPSQITPVTASGTFSGTLISLGSSSSSSSSKKKNVSFPVNLIAPDELLSEEEKEERKKNAELSGTSETLKDENNSSLTKTEEKPTDEEETILSEDMIPKLTGISDSPTTISGLTFTSKYSIRPNFTYQIAYNPSVLKTAEDFEWDENGQRSRMYNFKLPITLDNNLSYGGSFLSLSNSNTYSPVWQKHPFIHENGTYIDSDGKEQPETDWYSESAKTSLVKTDYAAQKQDLTSTNSVSFKPLAYLPHFKDTGITYRNTIKIIRTEFLSDEFKTSDDDAKYDYHPIWEVLSDGDDEELEDSITTHALDFTLAANEFDNKFTQTFTFTSTLKPQAESYYGRLVLGFPYTSLTFETGERKKTIDAEDFTSQPFKESLSLTLFNSLRISQSLSYDREEDYWDSLRFSASWKNLSATYTQSYTTGYDFEQPEGSSSGTWVARADKEFLPYSATLSYSFPTKTLYAWKNRVALGAGFSTNINADLLRPTGSTFSFSPSISLKIHDFVTMTFSTTSKNAAIYKYVNPDIYPPTSETNLFTDFFNSFRFDDENLRTKSGFKLQSMNFNLTHEMHDWDMTCSLKVEPKLITEGARKYYSYDPSFSLSIVWNPMSAMKAEISKDYDEKWTEIKLN